MRLAFLELGRRGAPYPPEITALRGRSGVYVIRERSTRRVVYVGESHTGALYRTLTRHFQVWTRAKRWWEQAYGRQHDPGVVYARGAVEVAAIPLAAARAVAAQRALIARLKPRDNINETEDVPF